MGEDLLEQYRSGRMIVAGEEFDAVVQLAGGFGNQLFQYAFGMELKTVHDLNVGFDIEFYRQPNVVSHNRLQLIDLGFDVPIASRPEAALEAARRLKWLPTRLQQSVVGLTYTKCPADRYVPVSISPGTNYFAGLWQSPKYFEGVQTDARQLFRKHLLAACETSHATGEDVVGFHVRRGDYLTHAQSHKLDYVAYLSAALDRLKEMTGRSDLSVAVFSDDPEWCETHLSIPHVDVKRGGTMLDDFVGLMNCKHKIISNSTFAWWAAFLGEANGLTIAPPRWHTATDIEEAQILMRDWHVVDY
ncbi:MAG: alpha-1,2-fucosyltransferase [Hyphomicrobiaceae bacterium]